MTDEARETLIDELLDDVLIQWLEDGEKLDDPREVIDTPELGLCIVHKGKSKHGYGSFIHYFNPREGIRRILEECEKRFDEMSVEANLEAENRTVVLKVCESQSEEDRARIIRQMAWFGSMIFIGGSRVGLGFSLGEGFDAGVAAAEMALAGTIIKRLDEPLIDSRSAVDELVKKTAETRRKALTPIFGNLPGLTARLRKTNREGVTAKKVRAAIEELGSQASQKSVAALLAVSEEALRQWLKGYQFKNWKAVMKRYATPSDN